MISFSTLTLLQACSEAPPPTVAPPPTPKVETQPLHWSAEWPKEQAVDRPVVVRFRVQNPNTVPMPVDDLASRPWLARFFAIDAANTPHESGNTPPDTDPGTTIEVPAGASEEVLLAMPTLLREGVYKLVVNVHGDRIAEGDLVLPIRQASAWTQVSSGGVWWVDQGASEATLWFKAGPPLQASGQAPVPLATRPAGWKPHLVATPKEDALLWTDGDGRLVFARVIGGARLGPEQPFTPPWPNAQPWLDAAALDGQGVLTVPLTVPPPDGAKSPAATVTVLGWDTEKRVAGPITGVAPAEAGVEVVPLPDDKGTAYAVLSKGTGPRKLELWRSRTGDPKGLEHFQDADVPAVSHIWPTADHSGVLALRADALELLHADFSVAKTAPLPRPGPAPGQVLAAWWSSGNPVVAGRGPDHQLGLASADQPWTVLFAKNDPRGAAAPVPLWVDGLADGTYTLVPACQGPLVETVDAQHPAPTHPPCDSPP